MNLKEQMSIVMSAAAIRRDQWAALVNARENHWPDWSPNDTIDELWEVWGSMSEDSEDTEAEDLTDIITKAIDYIQAYEMNKLPIYGFIGDDMPECSQCGTRAEIICQFDDETQRLKCLNKKCAFEFIGEWEEESDE